MLRLLMVLLLMLLVKLVGHHHRRALRRGWLRILSRWAVRMVMMMVRSRLLLAGCEHVGVSAWWMRWRSHGMVIARHELIQRSLKCVRVVSRSEGTCR